MKRSGAFVAVTVIVCAPGFAGCSGTSGGSAGDERPPEVAVAVDATVDPLALPLHLPVDLPAGHAWVGETQREHRDGETVAVTTAFQSDDGAVVALCAAAVPDAEHCRASAGTAEEVERRVGDHVVLLRPVRGSFGSAAQASFWETVGLTADPSRVAWLPASARP